MPRFLVDENDVPTDVVLPLAEWQQILAALEELDDIRAYDAAKRLPEDTVPLSALKPTQPNQQAG